MTGENIGINHLRLERKEFQITLECEEREEPD